MTDTHLIRSASNHGMIVRKLLVSYRVINTRKRSSTLKVLDIINVTSPEGQFYDDKTDDHIHNNTSKAALNMLTRSAAHYYANKVEREREGARNISRGKKVMITTTIGSNDYGG